MSLPEVAIVLCATAILRGPNRDSAFIGIYCTERLTAFLDTIETVILPAQKPLQRGQGPAGVTPQRKNVL